MSSLLQPIVIGDKLPLRNRVVMSALTRNRCVDNYKPGPSQVRYYTDRAKHGTGLIMTEGVLVDWGGCNFPFTPIMVHDDHVEAWREVVQSVHKEGGKIFLQAWHLGRVQNEQMSVMKGKDRPVLAPSAIKAEGGSYREVSGVPGHTAMITEIDDPRDVVQTYRHSAILTKKAGFDGIELLAQGGYLPHQFQNSRSNQRKDAYGGSVENRCRFTLEVVDAISEVFGGPECVCVKMSPADVLNDSATTFGEMKETYTYLIKELVGRKVGIINISRRGHNLSGKNKNTAVMTSRSADYPLPPNYDPVLDFGPLVKHSGSFSKLMANEDYNVQEAELLLQEEKADLISLGRPFIFNPDVVTRIKSGTAFAENDRGGNVFYGPYNSPDENYNDWPTIET